MPKITAISPQKRKGRFNIYVDGKFAFGIDEDTLIVESLSIGKEISGLEISELEEKSEVGKLYQKALRFLEYRPRSEKEMYDYLKRKLANAETAEECAEDAEIIVERILKKLKLHNYLNDEEFARWWVEQRRNSTKPRGINLIRSELYKKGVPREIIEQVLKTDEKLITEDTEIPASVSSVPSVPSVIKKPFGFSTEGTEEELAMRAAQNYLKKLKPSIRQLADLTPPKHWEFKRKLGAYLARRGFDWDTVKTVVDALCNEMVNN